jgi:trimethylamine:corrinoid methyltransferase-like protein
LGIGGNFISSRQTKKLFRDAYHTSTIFPRLSLEKWQELGCPDTSKFHRERTLDLLYLPNFPDDQHELLKKGEYLISEDRMYLS